MRWQKLCVVAMVPASNSDNARSRRWRRAATSASTVAARWTASSSPDTRAATGSASAAASSVKRARVRSRSSRVANLLNVTSRMSEISAIPSATYRAASPTIAYVLPVPALASRTVVPNGSGPVRSNELTEAPALSVTAAPALSVTAAPGSSVTAASASSVTAAPGSRGPTAAPRADAPAPRTGWDPATRRVRPPAGSPQ